MINQTARAVATSIIRTVPVLLLPVTTVMLSSRVLALTPIPVSSPVSQPNPTYTITPTPTPMTPVVSPPNPTYTITPTPTPMIPVVSPPNPTYTVTPTPYPVTPPNPNYAPYIETNKLPKARIGKKYSFTITAKDRNRSDALYMRISGLPAGLYQGPCAYRLGFFSVSLGCTIYGKPVKTGTYTVRVDASDYVNQPVVKYLKLQVTR